MNINTHNALMLTREKVTMRRYAPAAVTCRHPVTNPAAWFLPGG